MAPKPLLTEIPPKKPLERCGDEDGLDDSLGTLVELDNSVELDFEIEVEAGIELEIEVELELTESSISQLF